MTKAKKAPAAPKSPVDEKGMEMIAGVFSQLLNANQEIEAATKRLAELQGMSSTLQGELRGTYQTVMKMAGLAPDEYRLDFNAETGVVGIVPAVQVGPEAPVN